ncbi:2-C-methyl-D-erythritol 4-phosphate cytidylyltransferase [Staphylospora marina]|uniref:2-C-methyl-D-erythritol 4-phosphate cytidylyltransferase n=1 Tax=Staphylospora marina TaxID=2490858 RepID=UPI0030B99589
MGVILPAAGTGKRMGTKESKQFMPLAGRPVLLHTIDVFDQHPDVSEIVIAVREEELERTRSLVSAEGYGTPVRVVAGGRERQESVLKALRVVSAELVMVHDAVRPFVTHAAIDRLLDAARLHGAAILGVPVKDTVKVVNDAGIVEETPDRRKLWAVQTPQAFRREWLLSAHERAASRDGWATDDAMLLEEAGFDVRVVEGEYTNIKITTPEDWMVAEAIRKAGRTGHDSHRTRI